jgi:hypothetical protein
MRTGLFCCLLVLCSWAYAEEPKVEKLFNGKDLAGWKCIAKDAKADTSQTWTVLEGGVLKCTGKPTCYLITDKEYADYTLKLQWKYAPTDLKRPNSGVLLHCQPGTAFWPHSLEAQLAKGQAGDIWFQFNDKKELPTLEVDSSRRDAENKEGRHIFRLQRDREFEKPLGEWNEYEIRCNAGDITIRVNGKLVNEATKGSLKKGRIALQAEGAEIHFRGIELLSR